VTAANESNFNPETVQIEVVEQDIKAKKDKKKKDGE
jgi:hypothetical protein